MTKHEIDCGMDCLVCGEGMLLHTDASQNPSTEQREEMGMDPDEPSAWLAWDGDEVVCPSCGATAHFSANGEGGGEIVMDDTTPHNVECARKWEAAQEAKRRDHTPVEDKHTCTDGNNGGGDGECCACGARDCPHGEPLHYHHDGCPACYFDTPEGKR
jgi:hypothetical protein